MHHLYIAVLKDYISQQQYESFRGRYQECVKMLNGLEKTLEQQLDEHSRRWPSGRE